MPQYCMFDMLVKGEKEKVDEFVKIIQADYKDVPKHLWRVSQADINDEYDLGENKVVQILGECAWNVEVCMLDAPLSYHRRAIGTEHENESTCLQELTKELGLEIEIYSESDTCTFEEHYILRNGVLEVNEYKETSELEFTSEEAWKKFEESHDKTIPDENVHYVNEPEVFCYAKIGGFENHDWNLDY